MLDWLEQLATFRLTSDQGLTALFWAVAGIVALIFVLAWYGATRSILSDRWRKILSGLRIAALVFLVLYLINPILSYRERKLIKGAVAVAIDTSQSMSIADSVGDQKRFDAVRNLLTEDPHRILKRLSSRGDVKTYRFDQTAQPLSGKMLRQMEGAEGEATNLAAALDRIAADHKTEKFLAAVVFSDGQVNVHNDPLDVLPKLEIPVYTVGLGQIEDTRTRRADVALVRVDANPIATRDISTVARVRFQQHGFNGGLFPIRLVEGEKTIAEKTVAVEDVTRQEIELSFTPKEKGIHNYEVYVPEQENEAVAENNRLRFSILVNETTFRVLYVEGSLRWEFKYIKRMLEQDPTVEARTMVRTGAERFLTTGRGAVTMKDGFPATLDELAKFRVIILGDLPRKFWSDQQLDMLERWVSEREGGLLMLGGRELFRTGAYIGSPVARMAPATMRRTTPKAAESGTKVILTSQGQRSEILAGLDKTIDQIGLRRYYPLGDKKPAAQVLLESPTKEPLLLAQQYGKGRVAALATDSLWRAALGPREPGESTASEQVWRQLLQWLGGIEPGADEDAETLVANTDRTYYDPGRPIVVQARVNRKALPGGKVEVEARFKIDGKEVGRVPLRPDAREIQHTGSFEPKRDGQYDIDVALKSGGKEVATVSLSATAGHPYRELEQTSLNESLLRAIASETGGKYFNVANAAGLVEEVEQRKTVRERPVELRWFASRTVFLLFAAMLSAEWYFRRRKSLI